MTRSKPKALKVAEVQALKEQGYTYRKITEVLGLSSATIKRYLDMKDDDVKQYKSIIKKKQMVEDYETAEKARNLFMEKVDAAGFRDLVGLWKIARELQMPKGGYGTQTNVQVNIIQNEDSIQVEEVSNTTE